MTNKGFVSTEQDREHQLDDDGAGVRVPHPRPPRDGRGRRVAVPAVGQDGYGRFAVPSHRPRIPLCYQAQLRSRLAARLRRRAVQQPVQRGVGHPLPVHSEASAETVVRVTRRGEEGVEEGPQITHQDPQGVQAVQQQGRLSGRKPQLVHGSPVRPVSRQAGRLG